MLPHELLKVLAGELERLGLEFAVTGSMASTAYSVPRVTHDIDVVVALPPEKVPEFIAAFPPPDYYISEEAVRVAVAASSQFNIIHPTSGLKIDVMVAKDDEFDRSRMSRKRRLATGSQFATYFASPEDVIIKKMEFYEMGASDKHLRDIGAILRFQSDHIDREYIAEWAGKKGLLEIWNAILASFPP